MAELSIYFAGAIKGDAKFQSVHSSIVQAIKDAKSNVVVWSEKSPDTEALEATKASRQVFLRDVSWLERSDGLVAEVSGQSFGTGWEIAHAQKVMRMPILCLIQRGVDPPDLVAGNSHRGIYLHAYESEAEVREIVRDFVQYIGGLRTTEAGRPFDKASTDASYRHSKPELGWIEGSRTQGQTDLTLCSLVPLDVSVTSRRIRHVFTAMCGPLIEHREFKTNSALFRYAARRTKQLRRMVLFCDATLPSTDQGWLTSYAQWNNRQSIAVYNEPSDVSWIILGQTPRVDEQMGPDLRFRSGFAPSGTWSSRVYPIRTPSPRVISRPAVSYFPFSSESELLTRLELALDEIARDYSSKQTPLRVQAALSDFAQGTHNLQKMFWTPEREARFVSECLIHDALWPIVTVSGIEGTFLSGERAELLGLLKFHNYAPTPGHLYNLVRHAVNYEEKAFAKNIRAFKDVGILFKAPKGISGRAAARLVKLSRFGFILPARNIQKTLAEYERELTFVKEQLILTEFGRDLCDYVAGRRQKRELLEKLLEAKRKTADLLFDAAMLREQIPGRMEYLLELVPPEQRSRLLSIL